MLESTCDPSSAMLETFIYRDGVRSADTEDTDHRIFFIWFPFTP